MSTTTLEGLAELQRELERRLRNMQLASPKAMTDVVFDLLGKSVALAPVDLGDLRGSGHANVNDATIASGSANGGTSGAGSPGPDRGGKTTGEVAFSEPYAVIQHETLTFNHPKGGEAKYLEKPLAANMGKYVDRLTGKLSDAAQGKGS